MVTGWWQGRLKLEPLTCSDCDRSDSPIDIGAVPFRKLCGDLFERSESDPKPWLHFEWDHVSRDLICV